MSRIKDLKDKYPALGMSVLDVLSMMDPTKTNRYLPVIASIFNQEVMKRVNGSDIEYFKGKLDEMGFSEGVSKGMSDSELRTLYHMSDLISQDAIKIVNEFMNLNERGLIEDNDILKYKNITDLSQAISIAQMKSVDKEMASHVIRCFEDDEWLVLRPLTFASSCKYGAATKWCTTATSEPNHFHRYWNRGALIYILNKQTGYKVATQKYYDEDDRSTLWNAADREVNWADVDVPAYIFEEVKKEINKKVSNRDLCDDELYNKVMIECFPMREKYPVSDNDLIREVPTLVFNPMDVHQQQQRLDELIRGALTTFPAALRTGGEFRGELGVMEQQVQEPMPTQQEHDDRVEVPRSFGLAWNSDIPVQQA
jgi:hypothetical protein